MDDLTKRDDEKRLEQAREEGRKEERERQREREQAAEQARAKALEEERSRDKAREKALEEERTREKARAKQRSRGPGLTLLLWLIVLVIVIAVVAVLSLSVSVTTPTTRYALPYSTSYAVTFPEGQTLTIGNSQITVLSYQNELITDIDGDRQKLVVGENRVISEKRAVITTLGVIRLLDTDFQINLRYNGDRDRLAYFDMTIQTSQQVPDILLRQLIPREINAQPV